MPKFRYRPLVVEAEQWFPGKDVPGVCSDLKNGYACYVVNAHGHREYLAAGDWVILEPDGKGGHYAVRDAIFRRTFERAE